jgi:hypothetical protein
MISMEGGGSEEEEEVGTRIVSHFNMLDGQAAKKRMK